MVVVVLVVLVAIVVGVVVFVIVGVVVVLYAHVRAAFLAGRCLACWGGLHVVVSVAIAGLEAIGVR